MIAIEKPDLDAVTEELEFVDLRDNSMGDVIAAICCH